MNKLGVFLVFVLVFVCLVPAVSAVYVCPAATNSYSGVYTSGIAHVHPSDSDTWFSAIGEAFTANETCVLESVSFKLSKNGSPTGNLQAKVFTAVGTVGVDALPFGQVAVSAYLDSESLTSSPAVYTLDFTSSYVMVEGQNYVVVLLGSSEVMVPGNNVRVVQSDSDLFVDMNYVRFVDSSWSVVDPYDTWFILNGVTYVEATPTASPTVAPTQNVPPSDVFTPVPSYYMVLLVLFACVAVLAGLYVTFEREGENKGVALLFVLVGLVLFVILIVGYLVGF